MDSYEYSIMTPWNQSEELALISGDFYVFAGRLMENMSFVVAKMILLPSTGELF